MKTYPGHLYEGLRNCRFTKKIIISTDSLFDKRVLVKNYTHESEWRKRWENTTISLEQKWTQLFQAFIDKNIAIPKFKNLSSLYFVCLEHQHQLNEFFQL